MFGVNAFGWPYFGQGPMQTEEVETLPDITVAVQIVVGHASLATDVHVGHASDGRGLKVFHGSDGVRIGVHR